MPRTEWAKLIIVLGRLTAQNSVLAPSSIFLDTLTSTLPSDRSLHRHQSRIIMDQGYEEPDHRDLKLPQDIEFSLDRLSGPPLSGPPVANKTFNVVPTTAVSLQHQAPYYNMSTGPQVLSGQDLSDDQNPGMTAFGSRVYPAGYVHQQYVSPKAPSATPNTSCRQPTCLRSQVSVPDPNLLCRRDSNGYGPVTSFSMYDFQPENGIAGYQGLRDGEILARNA